MSEFEPKTDENQEAQKQETPSGDKPFIVKHLNEAGTTFFTRISAADERDAQAKLEAHHVGNRTTHVYADEGQETMEEGEDTFEVLSLEQEP